MSRDGYLPPGVEYSHLPGNRPEDVAWDNAVDALTDEDVADACTENWLLCAKAQEAVCLRCAGRGHEWPYDNEPDAGLDTCPVCEGRGTVWAGCDLKVLVVGRKLGPGDVTDCPHVAAIVEGRVEDALHGGPEYEPDDWRE
jgi:hypothetical protein